jgi:hypothetical protein
MQFKHTLAFTLTLIDVRNVFIECDGVFKLHIRNKSNPVRLSIVTFDNSTGFYRLFQKGTNSIC